MCTGFTKDTHQYFMKASPVRPGDFIEFLAEIDLLGALSACPGGDCSATHSSDAAACHALKIEIVGEPGSNHAEGLATGRRQARITAATVGMREGLRASRNAAMCSSARPASRRSLGVAGERRARRAADMCHHVTSIFSM